MKMKKSKETLLDLLQALAFVATTLAAVQMLAFVWMTAFVYRDNIRGYVSAGLTGLFILGLTFLLLIIYLVAVARRRRNRAAPYLLGACLGVPLAVLGSSVYAGVVFSLISHSWQKDVAISSVGGVLSLGASIGCHKLWMSKRTDNKSMQATPNGAPDG